MITSTLPSRSRGLAIVEFAIVLPICLILLIATAEFGRIFMQYDTLTKTVRDGARYVAGKALAGTTGVVSISSALQTQTKNVVVYGNALGAGAPVLPGLNAANITVSSVGFQNVSVSASYPYTPIFAFIPRFFYGGDVGTGGYTLQTAITMRAL
jgi:Flp pilus assembly protein TadG